MTQALFKSFRSRAPLRGQFHDPVSHPFCTLRFFKDFHLFEIRSRNRKRNANKLKTLDDGWPESEKDVFQAALSMVVVKDSR